MISDQNRLVGTGSPALLHQNVLIHESHSPTCECAVASVSTIHPRHRPRHGYITTLSVFVLDNANARAAAAAHPPF